MTYIKRFLFRLCLVLLIVPALLVLSLRFIDPLTSSVILQHNVTRDQGVEWISITWVDYDDISKAVPLAVLAAEDQRFPTHFGIDFTELMKALQSNEGQLRGASTITQQVAKNMFLWHGRSLVRKAIEAYIALLLELLLPKQRVLEIYLNIAQMGPNLYGIGNAATTYYNKPASKLNLYEASRIAAVLPNPTLYSVINSNEHVLKKQHHILEQGQRLGGYLFLEQLTK